MRVRPLSAPGTASDYRRGQSILVIIFQLSTQCGHWFFLDIPHPRPPNARFFMGFLLVVVREFDGLVHWSDDLAEIQSLLPLSPQMAIYPKTSCF